jgi:hypothetical protein
VKTLFGFILRKRQALGKTLDTSSIAFGKV